MALTQLPRLSSANDPLLQLAKRISEMLPHQGLSLIDKARRWSDRMLALTMLMIGWGSESSLIDRFKLARSCVVEIHPTRKRPGESYNGFIDCLMRHSVRLLGILTIAFRRRLIELADDDYRTFGFVVMGVDGTKIELPRSDSNLAHFDVANKKHAAPEMLLCGVFHVATRSLWSFAHDVARGSERGLFASMLPCLPEDSLVVADAGFVGWNTMSALIEAGQHFVIRAGSNVKLLKTIGHIETHGDIVYLWPERQQKKNIPPIKLRMVIVHGQKNCQMCLLTNVLDEKRLSDKQIAELYAMRWHVEVSYRWLKSSLKGRKMLSTSSGHAKLEMDWTLMSLWLLTLISLASGVSGSEQSIAGTLRIVRRAMTQRRSPKRQRVTDLLRRARRDRYTRHTAKSKRHWPKRSRLHRCKIPLPRMATPDELARFQAIFAQTP